MKYHKISIYLTAFLLILFTFSCKKESITRIDKKEVVPAYYFKFKVDGVQKIFREEALSVLFTTEGKDKIIQHRALLNGNAIKSDTAKNWLTILFESNAVIKANKMYTNFFTNTSATEKASLMFIIYKDENGETFMSSGDENSTLFGINSDGQFKFSEIDAKYTKGSFNATVYSLDYKERKKITDGEFFLERN